MEIQITHQPSYALAIARLIPNETINIEPGAMVSFSEGVTVQTQVQGGFMRGIKRMFGGESFFMNTFTAPAQGGEITLAPQLPGDMLSISLEPGQTFLLKSGAYIASEPGISFDTSWGGAKGFFGGAGLLLLKVTGRGSLLLSVFGAIEERMLVEGQKYTIDTGHIVAFDESVRFQVRGMGNLKSTLLSGEGLVCELTGPGRVLMQTRSEEAFIDWLRPYFPSSTSSNSS
jgi:uncharacterized protein (TIGR00266 family)